MRERIGRISRVGAPLAIVVSSFTACHEGGSARPSIAGAPGSETYLPATSAPASGSGTETEAHAIDPAGDLLDAAETVQLTETQKQTVRAWRDRLARYDQNARAALRALREDIATQVRAGAIRTAGLRIDENWAAGALTIHVDEGAEAMNALYGALDSSQRAAIVASVRAARHAEGTLGGTCRDRAAGVTARLGLDPAQRRLASALLVELPATASLLEDRRRQLDAVVDGFVGSHFDGWTIVPHPLAPPAESLRQGVECEVTFLEKLLPMLSLDQRERLASILVTGADGERPSDDDSGL